jgi:hypothetical protein
MCVGVKIIKQIFVSVKIFTKKQQIFKTIDSFAIMIDLVRNLVEFNKSVENKKKP